MQGKSSYKLARAATMKWECPMHLYINVCICLYLSDMHIYTYNILYNYMIYPSKSRIACHSEDSPDESQMVTAHPCCQLLLLPGTNVLAYLKCNGSYLFWLNVRKEVAISQSPQLRWMFFHHSSTHVSKGNASLECCLSLLDPKELLRST